MLNTALSTLSLVPSLTTPVENVSISVLPSLYRTVALLNSLPTSHSAMRSFLMELAANLTMDGAMDLTTPSTVQSLASLVLLTTSKPKVPAAYKLACAQCALGSNQ